MKKSDEVQHSSVEVYGQITYEPLCPGTFPFGQKTECPLYRSEDGQHPQQDLLAVDGRPLANVLKRRENKNR